MFTRITNYLQNLKSRFTAAPHNDRSMMISMSTGAIYTAIRAATTDAPVNIPLAGNVKELSTTARLLLGSYVGAYIGSNLGNRYGQIVHAFQQISDTPINNELFLMRTLPILFAFGADIYLAYCDFYGGNPFFGSLDSFTSAELYILTTLNAAYVGGTIAYRLGRTLDYITDKQLVADLGLFSAIKWCHKKMTQTSDYQPIDEESALIPVKK